MTDYQMWMKIARDAERRGPDGDSGYGIAGLCYAAYVATDRSFSAQYRGMKALLYDMFGIDAPRVSCGGKPLPPNDPYGYFWPTTGKGWEQRVIAATLLAELSRDAR